MKTLILIRHAKSDWSHAGLQDYDRPLNNRGCADAPEMGRRLANRNLIPDLFIASTAKRAQLSALLMAEAMGYAEEKIDWRKELYLASPPTILNLISHTPLHVSCLALLAHNPDITELAEQLSGQYIGNIPTAGSVALTADIEDWACVNTHWKLNLFDYPKRTEG